MLCHSLSCTKSARNSSSSTLRKREEHIYYTLTCNKRFSYTKLLAVWTRFSYRPVLSQADFFIKFGNTNYVVYSVIAGALKTFQNAAAHCWRNHYFFCNGICFLYSSQWKARFNCTALSKSFSF